MENRLSAYKGCLLGLAIGDAMGYTIDHKTLAQIREDYGPNGLLGYDLANGYADTTSYTQIAAYVCNGLLFGMTRGQLRGVKNGHGIKATEKILRRWITAGSAVPMGFRHAGAWIP